MNSEWISYQIGVLQTMVSEGQRAANEGRASLHRRIEDTRRELLVHIHRLDRKQKNGNGNGRIPYAKLACLLALIILGAMGHIWPQAVKSATVDLIKRMLLSQVGGG